MTSQEKPSAAMAVYEMESPPGNYPVQYVYLPACTHMVLNDH